MEKAFCKRCRREFGAKKVRLSNKPVPAGVLPPCQWNFISFTFDSYKFTAPRPTDWNQARVMSSYDFEDGVAYSKPNTLASLLACPSCGCWRNFSNGPNFKCDNCGRAWRKEYSPQRGRPPILEQERNRTGGGTYRRKSKDIRWRR